MRTTVNNSSLSSHRKRAETFVDVSDLEMVQGHVKNSQQRVALQRKLIAILAAQRRPLNEARELLQLFEVTLQVHLDHLAALEEVAKRAPRSYRTAGSRTSHREAADRFQILRDG